MSKLFGPPPQKTATGVDTLIGRQTEVLGDVRFSGGLHVDGKIKGKVVANADKNATLSVSESGSIEGNVRVPNIVLNGQVVGDVHASERIQLAARARVTGNVYYKIIQMEGGATVNGQMVHETGEVLAAIGHAKPAGNEETPESAAATAARMSAVKS
ncbi:MAG: polymer-forming cytoskeletal protein [Gammaproteobacteria bacterium]